MASDALQAAAEALPPPWTARYFTVVDSTQDEARRAARQGAPSRSIFIADFQCAGRGRQGRSWTATPGTGLLCSMLFREETSTPQPFRWTSLAAVSVSDAIGQLIADTVASIKWPNDVMIDGRKVAGILAETTWDGQQLQIIVGVGVNVSADQTDLAGLPSATSLSLAAGQDVDRGSLLTLLVQRMDHWLEQPPEALRSTWQGRLWGRGQRLRLLDLGREEEVVVLGAEEDGSLRVRLADGTERQTTTGELLV